MSSSSKNHTKSLWQFYNHVSQFEYLNPSHAYQLFDDMLRDIDSYVGVADVWHNCAMVAGRVRHLDAQLQIVQAGLRQHEEDVDLLCDEFLYSYTTHFDAQRADELWDTLDGLPKNQTGAYWRYWTYGATYYAKVHQDVEKAIQLLDEGLYNVQRDGLMNIIRTYRRILIDSVPRQDLTSLEDIEAEHHEIMNILENRYKLGIKLGVENGYVLAADLAKLYQERAGECIERDMDDNDVRKYMISNLRRALQYLDLAEYLFTGSENHQIHEIYEQRIRVLMALHEYEEALQLMRSIPKNQVRDLSMQTMMYLAAYKTGTELRENNSGVSIEQALEVAVPYIFQDDGDILYRLIRQDPDKIKPILGVLQRIQSEQEDYSESP